MLSLTLPAAPAAAQPSTPTHAPLDLGPLFVHARDALIVGDVDSCQIVAWNPAAETLLGYPARSAIGQPMDMLMPMAVARLHRERLAHYARTGEVAVLSPREATTTAVVAVDGRELSVEMSVAPLELTVGVPSTRLVLLTLRDAGLTRRIEPQTLDTTREAAAPAALTDRLDGAHRRPDAGLREVRLALRRARRAAALLKRRLAAQPPTATERLARVVEARTAAVERALDLIEDLAAIDNDAFAVQVERVNLVPLVARLAARVRQQTAVHRLNVAVPQGLTAQADPLRLEQVLVHLVGEAMRRNPRGCWIDVDLRRPLAGVARLEIRDYGRRLSARERSGLPGHGSPDRAWLRAEHIVARHRGRLVIQQPAEGGLRVSITLPTGGIRPARTSVLGERV